MKLSSNLHKKINLVAPIFIILFFLSTVAEAIPGFARKYQANCALCHTNEPRLSPFGQKFLENGYQFPGTTDGAETAKSQLEGEQGPVTLDQLSNMFAIRIRADIQKASFEQVKDGMKADGVNEQTAIDVPRIINLFFGGTATKNLSYFTEAEFNTQEDGGDTAVKFERAYLQFSNLGGKQGVANVKVGNFDPSSLFAFPTHRQQMSPILPVADTTGVPPSILRVPVLPLAFSSKMFGLTKGNAYVGEEGYAILPFQPYLYNAPTQKSISVHGRPMGDASAFMYQIGVAVNDRATLSTNRQSRYDSYLMGRYDFSFQNGVQAQVSAFYYKAPNAALASLAPNDTLVTAMNTTDIDRMGIGGRVQWGQFDIYGTYIQDEIDKPVFMMAPLNTSVWETTGSGISAEVDWRFHNKWMLGVRYDQMSPGGLSKLPMGADPARTKINVDASFLGAMLKYYMRPNIGLYLRTHINLESSTRLPDTTGQMVQISAFNGSEHPATNLKNITTVGIDMAF